MVFSTQYSPFVLSKSDKLASLISAAGVEVEPIWPNLFAKALEGKDIGSFLFNVGSGEFPLQI